MFLAGFSLDDVANANIWHIVHAYVVPVSKHTMRPVDNAEGCAYVDMLDNEDDVGLAHTLLSYSWSYRVTEVSAALSAWTDWSVMGATPIRPGSGYALSVSISTAWPTPASRRTCKKNLENGWSPSAGLCLCWTSGASRAMSNEPNACSSSSQRSEATR